MKKIKVKNLKVNKVREHAMEISSMFPSISDKNVSVYNLTDICGLEIPTHADSLFWDKRLLRVLAFDNIFKITDNLVLYKNYFLDLRTLNAYIISNQLQSAFDTMLLAKHDGAADVMTVIKKAAGIDSPPTEEEINVLKDCFTMATHTKSLLDEAFDKMCRKIGLYVPDEAYAKFKDICVKTLNEFGLAYKNLTHSDLLRMVIEFRIRNHYKSLIRESMDPMSDKGILNRTSKLIERSLLDKDFIDLLDSSSMVLSQIKLDAVNGVTGKPAIGSSKVVHGTLSTFLLMLQKEMHFGIDSKCITVPIKHGDIKNHVSNIILDQINQTVLQADESEDCIVTFDPESIVSDLVVDDITINDINIVDSFTMVVPFYESRKVLNQVSIMSDARAVELKYTMGLPATVYVIDKKLETLYTELLTDQENGRLIVSTEVYDKYYSKIWNDKGKVIIVKFRDLPNTLIFGEDSIGGSIIVGGYDRDFPPEFLQSITQTALLKLGYHLSRSLTDADEHSIHFYLKENDKKTAGYKLAESVDRKGCAVRAHIRRYKSGVKTLVRAHLRNGTSGRNNRVLIKVSE